MFVYLSGSKKYEFEAELGETGLEIREKERPGYS